MQFLSGRAVLFIAVVLVSQVASRVAASGVTSDSSGGSHLVRHLEQPPELLYVDVDNCLYRDEHMKKGIETQIVRGIKAFCRDRCRLNEAQADGLFEIFGSTEEGLRRTLWRNATVSQLRSFLRDYYDTAYANVDVTELLPSKGQGSVGSTGYSHSAAQQRTIRKLLRSSPSLVTLSSNSPAFHVRKVVQALGLCEIFDSHKILTPDNCASSTLAKIKSKEEVYPTKVSPIEYFGKFQLPKNEIALVDDSRTNLKAVRRYMRGYRVSKKQPLLEALARTWGWLDEDYEFSSIDYLKAKNSVDEVSINRNTWNVMLSSIAEAISGRPQNQPLTIVDVGSGLLSMHRLLVEKGAEDLPTLISVLRQQGLVQNITQLNYLAYEPNEDLRKPCVEYLLENGYLPAEEYLWDAEEGKKHVKEMIFEKEIGEEELTVRVALRFWDFQREIETTKESLPSPDFIVGCCFADLLSPDVLTGAILKRFLNHPEEGQQAALLYFPITFRGMTQFVPASPAAVRGKTMIPSDTQAFAAYSKVLQDDFGHSLDPEMLVQSVKNYGGELIARGASDWKIDPVDHEYLWRTMLYFFATGAAPELQSLNYDATEWIQRAWDRRPSIQASNMDLLLRVPYIGKWETFADDTNLQINQAGQDILEIQFTAPREVSFVNKKRISLNPGQVRIRSQCSLISSGTELKIFTGSFDDAALDINIKSMEGQRMGYPLAYGYSLVGQVVECGEGVDPDKYMGKSVFTFSPHASEVVTDSGSVQLVPDGIDPFDAIFMPSVETALSIVHDAHPRLGEKIIVFGQGLIGLLVTVLLSSMSLGLHDPGITTVDTFPERLALSALLGSEQAVFPSEVDACGDFDVAIEASGNYRALQSAIDHTRNGGRVVIASWYGSESVSLKLGIDFHRSHKQIKTSQVSEIPAELRETWTKERRFGLVWQLLHDTRPSRLLTRKVPPADAKQAYEDLLRGEQVSVAFDYSLK